MYFQTHPTILIVASFMNRVFPSEKQHRDDKVTQIWKRPTTPYLHQFSQINGQRLKVLLRCSNNAIPIIKCICYCVRSLDRTSTNSVMYNWSRLDRRPHSRNFIHCVMLSRLQTLSYTKVDYCWKNASHISIF